MEITGRLQELQALKKRNKAQCNEAASLIWEEYKKSEDIEQLVELLQTVRTDMCRAVAQKYFNNFRSEDLELLCDEYFYSKYQQTPIEKDICLCVELQSAGLKDMCMAMAMRKIAFVHGRNINNKNKEYIANKLLGETNYSVLDISYDELDYKDKKIVFQMLSNTYAGRSVPQPVLDWGKRYEFEFTVVPAESFSKNKGEEIKTSVTPQLAVTDTPVGNRDSDILNEGIKQAQNKIDELNKSLSGVLKSVEDKYWSIYGLRQELDGKNKEIAQHMTKIKLLSEEKDALQRKMQELERKIDQFELILTEKDKRIGQLLHDLDTITNADEASASQQADALRTQIISAFRLPYNDLKICTDEGYSRDNYDMLIADFKQMFIALRRLGISFE